MSSIQRIDNEFKGLFERGVDEERDGQIGSRGNDNGFMQRYGWIYQATIIAEHERINLANAFELPTIQALNDLSYIKAKNSFDAEQMKKIYGKHS